MVYVHNELVLRLRINSAAVIHHRQDSGIHSRFIEGTLGDNFIAGMKPIAEFPGIRCDFTIRIERHASVEGDLVSRGSEFACACRRYRRSVDEYPALIRAVSVFMSGIIVHSKHD